MICENCKTEIPSSFNFAISNNACPKCGNKIINDEEKMRMFQTLKGDLMKLDLAMDKCESVEKIVSFLLNKYIINVMRSDIKVEQPISVDLSKRVGGNIEIAEEEGISEKDMRAQFLKQELEKMRMAEGEEEEFDDEEVGEDVSEDVSEDDFVRRLQEKAKKGRTLFQDKISSKSGPQVKRLS